MNKVFVVKENHLCGSSFIIGVCPNRDLAEKLQRKNESLWDIEGCKITSEIWDSMISKYYSSEEYNTDKTMLETMIKLFPEYSASDIEMACHEYKNRSYISTVVEEINLYALDSDIALYGIDRR